MKHEYKIKSHMDLAGQSSDYLHTPGLRAQQLPFYLESCGHFYANSGYFTEREGLGSYLLIFTLQGSGRIKSKENEILIEKNCAAVIDCIEYQLYMTASECTWEFMWIHFNGTAAALYCDMINGSGLALARFDENAGVRGLIGDIFRIIKEKNRDQDFLLSEKIMGIVTGILLAKQTAITIPGYGQHKQDILQSLEIIKMRYPQRLTIDELSKNAHISKFYFVRIFKDFTGQTPYEYLMSYRINESKTLLTRTNASISDISGRCGFTDTSNYIRCFKRATGKTPNAFRKDKVFII